MVEIDLKALTFEQLDDLIRAAVAQRDKLAAVNQAPAILDRVVIQAARAKGLQQGDPWTQPVGTGYPFNWTVTHAGKTWRSTVTNNVWEPGVSGWREETADGSAPPFRKPSGRHDAYRVGERIMWQGQTYGAVLDYVVHSPAEHPASWKAIVGAGDGEPGTEPPPPTPDPGQVTPWAEWVNYKVDNKVSYQGVTYRVRQAHTSQPGWQPPNAPALFEPVP